MYINTEIKKGSKLKNFFRKLHDKSEDILFSVVEKIPERFISPKMMNLLERYLNKRIVQLEQKNIENKWKKAYLDKAI